MAKNTGGAKKTGTGLLDFVTNVAATVKETVESAIETTVNGVGNYREGFNKRYKNPILASLYEIIYLSKNEEIELKAVQFLAQLFEHTKKIDDKIKDEIAKFISDNSSILYTNTKVRASTKEIKQYFDTFREDIKEFKNYMLSIENSEHKTILQYLIEQGNLEALRVLCSTKNDFNKAEADKNAFFDAFKKEENNREEIFEILVKSSIDPNIKNKNGLTVLHLAVMGGCIKIIKLLLSMRDIDVNVQDNDGLTPLLHILVELIIRDQNAEKKFDNREHLESFALLVKRTNVNILLDHKNILFHIMAIKNPVLDSQLLKHVLSNEKIDLNVTIRKSTSLLHYAIADVNSLPYCMLLLERGARTDLMDEDGYLPIHRAVEYGFVEAAEAIITHDQNLAHKNSEYKESYKVLTKSGQNCLYIAAEKGFIKIIEVLLKKDTSLLKGVEGKLPPGHLLAQAGNMLGLINLIEVAQDKLDKNMLDQEGNSLIHHIVMSPLIEQDKIETVQKLSKLGCSIDLMNKEGLTALNIVLRNGWFKLAETLVNLMSKSKQPEIENPKPKKENSKSKKDNPELKKENPETQMENPLHSFLSYIEKNPKITENELSIMKKLLEFGVDPNATNQGEKVSLHLACKLGNFKLVELLINKGANVNALDPMTKNTPLLILVDSIPNDKSTTQDQLEIAKILISKGAEPVTNNEGRNPLKEARTKGLITLVVELKELRDREGINKSVEAILETLSASTIIGAPQHISTSAIVSPSSRISSSSNLTKEKAERNI